MASINILGPSWGGGSRHLKGFTKKKEDLEAFISILQSPQECVHLSSKGLHGLKELQVLSLGHYVYHSS